MAKMHKSHKKSGRRRRNSMKKGGSCGSASTFAQSVYGDAASQHAVGVLPNGGTSNQIVMNHPQLGGNGEAIIAELPGTPAPMIVGGNHQLSPASYSDSGISNQSMMVLPSASSSSATNLLSMKGGRRRRGGNVLGEIAVPATLLVANEFIKNRSKKSYSRSNGRNKIYSRRRSNRRRR
jgi:hypothetical protein